MDEFALIEYLRKRIPGAVRVSVGIGDDAAVLNLTPGKQLLVSTDVIVENVDFTLKKSDKNASLRVKGSYLRDLQALAGFTMTTPMSPEKIGRKALAVNLSDIAAMGAKPIAFVITIGKPKYISETWLKRFYDGLLGLAKEFDVSCVGGDFSRSGEFFASVTILGEVSPDQIVKRSGAMAGDWIAVTGTLGGSLLRHQHDFTPRVREGVFLSEKFTPTSMIDISDGLVQDLSHILKASRAGAVLDLDEIPVSKDAKRMARTVILRSAATKNLKPGSFAFCEAQDDGALKRALSDGEDFELLFTVPPWQKMMLAKCWKKEFPKVSLTWIGKVEGRVPRISWRQGGRKVLPPKLVSKGFSHF